MQEKATLDLVDRVCTAKTEQSRTEEAANLKAAISGMNRSIESLEGQLKDFYDAQVEHDGNSLEDYERMVGSLNDQVKSYIDEYVV